MTAIEEMAGMDVLCSDKTGTLTLNKLTVDNSLIEVAALIPSFRYINQGQDDELFGQIAYICICLGISVQNFDI